MHRLIGTALIVSLSGCLGPVFELGTSSGAVGPGGGEVKTALGVGVKVPAGALSKSVVLQVGPASAAQPRPAGTAVGDMVRFGPEGQTFAVAATVTLEVDQTKLPAGKTLANVVILRAPVGSSIFEALPTRMVDAAHVAADTLHFSVFIPIVPDASAQDGGIDGGPGTDLDGGPLCVEACSGGDDGGADCACASTCGGRTLELVCSGAGPFGCACVLNGQQIGIVQLDFCPGPGALEAACNLKPDPTVDAGYSDAGYTDGGVRDGGFPDGGFSDGGSVDGGAQDGGSQDAGLADGGSPDGG